MSAKETPQSLENLSAAELVQKADTLYRESAQRVTTFRMDHYPTTSSKVLKCGEVVKGFDQIHTQLEKQGKPDHVGEWKKQVDEYEALQKDKKSAESTATEPQEGGAQSQAPTPEAEVEEEESIPLIQQRFHIYALIEADRSEHAMALARDCVAKGRPHPPLSNKDNFRREECTEKLAGELSKIELNSAKVDFADVTKVEPLITSYHVTKETLLAIKTCNAFEEGSTEKVLAEQAQYRKDKEAEEAAREYELNKAHLAEYERRKKEDAEVLDSPRESVEAKKKQYKTEASQALEEKRTKAAGLLRGTLGSHDVGEFVGVRITLPSELAPLTLASLTEGTDQTTVAQLESQINALQEAFTLSETLIERLSGNHALQDTIQDYLFSVGRRENFPATQLRKYVGRIPFLKQRIDDADRKKKADLISAASQMVTSAGAHGFALQEDEIDGLLTDPDGLLTLCKSCDTQLRLKKDNLKTMQKTWKKTMPYLSTASARSTQLRTAVQEYDKELVVVKDGYSPEPIPGGGGANIGTLIKENKDSVRAEVKPLVDAILKATGRPEPFVIPAESRQPNSPDSREASLYSQAYDEAQRAFWGAKGTNDINDFAHARTLAEEARDQAQEASDPIILRKCEDLVSECTYCISDLGGEDAIRQVPFPIRTHSPDDLDIPAFLRKSGSPLSPPPDVDNGKPGGRGGDGGGEQSASELERFNTEYKRLSEQLRRIMSGMRSVEDVEAYITLSVNSQEQEQLSGLPQELFELFTQGINIGEATNSSDEVNRVVTLIRRHYSLAADSLRGVDGLSEDQYWSYYRRLLAQEQLVLDDIWQQHESAREALNLVYGARTIPMIQYYLYLVNQNGIEGIINSNDQHTRVVEDLHYFIDNFSWYQSRHEGQPGISQDDLVRLLADAKELLEILPPKPQLSGRTGDENQASTFIRTSGEGEEAKRAEYNELLSDLLYEIDQAEDHTFALEACQKARRLASSWNDTVAIADIDRRILYRENVQLQEQVDSKIDVILKKYESDKDIEDFLIQAKALSSDISKLNSMELNQDANRTYWYSLSVLGTLYHTVMADLVGSTRYTDVITVASQELDTLKALADSLNKDQTLLLVTAYLSHAYEVIGKWKLAMQALEENIALEKKINPDKPIDPRDTNIIDYLRRKLAEQKEIAHNPTEIAVGKPVRITLAKGAEPVLLDVIEHAGTRVEVAWVTVESGIGNLNVDIHNVDTEGARLSHGYLEFNTSNIVTPYVHIDEYNLSPKLSNISPGENGTITFTLTLTESEGAKSQPVRQTPSHPGGLYTGGGAGSGASEGAVSEKSVARTTTLPAYVAEEINTAPWIPEKLREPALRLYELAWGATEEELALVAQAEEWATAAQVPVLSHAIAALAELIQGTFTMRDIKTGQISPESIQRAKGHFAQWFAEGLKGTVDMGELFVGGEARDLKDFIARKTIDLLSSDDQEKNIIAGLVVNYIASKLKGTTATDMATGSGLQAMGSVLQELIQDTGTRAQLTEALVGAAGFDLFLAKIKDQFSAKSSTV